MGLYKKWLLSFLIFGVAGLLASLWLLSCCTNYFDACSSIIADIPDSPVEIITTNLPSVACFFMVNQQSIENAVAVRYSNWAKKCSHFVIFANGVAGGGEQQLDGNTILVDIQQVIQLELMARGGNASSFNSTNFTTFPSPKDETKKFLTLKAFYSWMFMARRYSDRVDYIMKADPDTYMIMHNYLNYLGKYYSPGQNAYIGRVFKTNGDHHMPFVTGLSCTLSKTTAKLLLSASTVQKNNVGVDDINIHKDCSAEVFLRGGEADDHSLAMCLSSQGIYPAYTRDELGRERFLHFNPWEHAYGDDKAPAWYRNFSFTPLRPRKACCSNDACAFHYVKPERQNDTLVWVEGIWQWKSNDAVVDPS